ncbi:MAG: AzlC family ABC transporter permease [Prolixibacteraceae bacterium]|nr:AzlC family ABC transporter permease [Burkholderiales bacterium]
MLIGAFPFGVIYGVVAIGAGVPIVLAQAISLIIFAGSAQFIAAQLIGVGASGTVIVMTTFIVNLRHALYSASLAPYLNELPRCWRWLLSYLLTDEAYAAAIAHYRDNAVVANKHWYFLGAGLGLWACWQASTAVGIFLGTEVPSELSLDFTLSLTFIALVVPGLKTRADLVAALVGGIVAVGAYGLPYKLGLILAAFCGIAAGLFVSRLRR